MACLLRPQYTRPANILVSPENGTPAVKVIDFGLAKVMWPGLTEQTLTTQLGIVMGTPAYMAPEQADRFHRNVDHRVDVCSLGVILYELLTGSTPLDSEQLRGGSLEVLRTLHAQEVPPLGTRLSSARQQAREIAACRQTNPTALMRALNGAFNGSFERPSRRTPNTVTWTSPSFPRPSAAFSDASRFCCGAEDLPTAPEDLSFVNAWGS